MKLVQSTIYNGIEYKVGDYVKIEIKNDKESKIIKIEAIEKETNGIIGKNYFSIIRYTNLCKVIKKKKIKILKKEKM